MQLSDSDGKEKERMQSRNSDGKHTAVVAKEEEEEV
jgi:hypothetical protein